MSSSENTGYKSVVKSTALFGGAQIIQIVIAVAKSKLVALWLGTQGMGLMSIFSMVSNLVFNISNLGLASSEVKVVASEISGGDDNKVKSLVKAIHRWVLVLGLFGGVVVVLLAKHLSSLYFESAHYTLCFALLFFVIVFNSLFQEHLAVMQGFRALKSIVKTNILGALCGFIVSILLFYFFRIDGIIWSLVLTALLNCVISHVYYKKLQINTNFYQSVKDSIQLGSSAVKIGIAMAVSAVAVSAVEFIVRSFITSTGGIEEVGLFSAGWAINAQYLGLVFTAMAKDYFPRLSQNHNDNQVLKKLMSQQGEVALIILTPLIVGMLVLIEPCVSILYSREFLVATPMIEWLLVGSFVKSGSWGISFVFLAKGDMKAFLYNELGIKLITLPSYLLGYKLWGLEGVGYAYTFIYVVYFILVALVAYKRYGLTYTPPYWNLFIKLFLLIVIYKLTATLFLLTYPIKIIILLFVLMFALYELNKRIPIKAIFRANKS